MLPLLLHVKNPTGPCLCLHFPLLERDCIKSRRADPGAKAGGEKKKQNPHWLTMETAADTTMSLAARSLASATLPFTTRMIRTPLSVFSIMIPSRGFGAACLTRCGGATTKTESATVAGNPLQAASGYTGSKIAALVTPRSVNWCGTPWPNLAWP